MSTPYRYPVHSILLFPYVLMKIWLIPKVLEDGAYSFFNPLSWVVVGLNNLHWNAPCYLFRFPISDFCKNFSKEVQVPQWYSRVAQVYDPHSWLQYLTILFLFLKLICGVCGQEDVCIPWLLVLPSRRVIHDGVGTQPNSGLMEHGISGRCEGMKQMASHLDLFELHDLQLFLGWRLVFSLFFREDNSTLPC